jgi:5-methylcytosine-specific restriction endonuclease McrA
MPVRTPRFVPTDAEREEHVKKYPLPAWCKTRKTRKLYLRLRVVSPEKSNELAQHLEFRTKPKKKKKSNRLNNCPDWQLLRRRVLHFYGAICMCCGSTKNINIDHIKPKSKYPELAMEFSNLQVLCWPCNKSKNNRHETDYR